MKKITATLAALMLGAILLTGCTQDDRVPITLLHGPFSEIEIIMQMAALLIEEHTDLRVEWQDSMMTVLAANALNDHHADLYVGYDGTLLTTILGYDPTDVPPGELLFDWVQRRGSEVRGLTLLAPFGFENTYALAIHREFAEQHNIRTISDLVPFGPELVFGAEHEFFDVQGTMRFNPFNEHYGFEWRGSNPIDIALKYAAMAGGSIDVTMVYSTDGLNVSFDLFVLEDDLAFFPEYNAGFQFRDTLFEEFAPYAPNLRDVLDMLSHQIDNYAMIYMNYAVDELGENHIDVARRFLQENGMIQ
ncbi:MAG: glycine/betaine ABC transporter substrate-binding protein [Defluviitaleaceae bacterium]|nr:glycine/betaine ABC transporter substrate-binding protein [Defluviitaleaceae bacterium]